MSDEIELQYPEELEQAHTRPDELEEINAVVLAATSDEYSLDYPSVPNISRSLSQLSETHLTRFKGRVRRSIDELETEGYVQDRGGQLSSVAYEPTEAGKELLDRSNIFKYLDNQLREQ